MAFILKKFENQLVEIGHYQAVWAVQHGLPFSHFHIFSILELYNPEIGIFFTPIGEMGLALHELYEISGLPIGKVPYEEYVYTGEELHLLKVQHTEFMTLVES